MTSDFPPLNGTFASKVLTQGLRSIGEEAEERKEEPRGRRESLWNADFWAVMAHELTLLCLLHKNLQEIKLMSQHPNRKPCVGYKNKQT